MKKIDNLTLAKSELCPFDRFTRTFIEKDKAFTIELKSLIQDSFTNSDFHGKVMDIYTKNLEREMASIVDKMEERKELPNCTQFYQPQIDAISLKLKIKTFSELLSFIESDLVNNPGTLYILDNSYKNANDESGASYITENYKYYYIGRLLYDDYQRNKGMMEFLGDTYPDLVFEAYKDLDIDLLKSDLQFKKYKLLTLNENIRICNDKDSQTLYDDRIAQYFWINVPRNLLFSIEQLIDAQCIKDISFRVNYISECIPCMEEMEFGSPLKINIESLPELSKFYSVQNYENKLWVAHDKGKSSLTFEEHLDEFDIVGDDIITQVIHLEYYIENGNCFINHIDHEYIAYTLEQYEHRLNDSNVKGYKKIKTFKVDNAKIPVNYEHNNQIFLYQVLDSYLKNKDLVNEYFEKI